MTKKKWQKFKKNLPSNWAQQVSDSLKSNGFTLSAAQVSAVRYGNIVNLEWQKNVWEEINNLEQKTKKEKAQILRLQAA